MSNFEAFTIKHNGHAAQLFTPCHLCEAFVPSATSVAPNLVEFTALWDTGASNTVISKSVVSALGLKPIGVVPMSHADGTSMVERYMINIMLPNGVGYKMVPVLCSGLQGTDVLIGMDIIGTGDFSVSNVGGSTVFSFRVPSVKVIDYVEEHRKSKLNAASSAHIGIARNDKCHCGSGKKYKHCHGK